MQQPVIPALDALDFPELHDESIPAMAFVRSLTRLITASGVRDFSLRDLHKPEAPRLKRNLSAIINFAKFREEKLAAYTELQEEFEGLVSTKDAALSENAALQSELTALQEAGEAELPEVARLEEERARLVAANQNLNRQQAGLSSEVRTLKHQANTLTDEAAVLRQKVSAALSEEEHLRMQIVHSPEKVRARLQEISNAVESERGALAEAEKRSRDFLARLEAVSRAEREVQRVVSVMTSADEAIAVKKEASKRVKELKAAIAATEHEAAQLAAKRQHLSRQQASLLERIARLESQVAMRRDAVESTIEERLRDKEAAEAENAAAAAKVAENDAFARSIKDRIAELKAAHEASLGNVLEKWESLRNSVKTYHAHMETEMSANPTPSREIAPKPMLVR